MSFTVRQILEGADAQIAGEASHQLIGAGGGGFLLFYTEDKKPVRHALREAGLEEVRIRFDFEGTKTLVQ